MYSGGRVVNVFRNTSALKHSENVPEAKENSSQALNEERNLDGWKEKGGLSGR